MAVTTGRVVPSMVSDISVQQKLNFLFLLPWLNKRTAFEGVDFQSEVIQVDKEPVERRLLLSRRAGKSSA